jgi:hypothetical protein
MPTIRLRVPVGPRSWGAPSQSGLIAALALLTLTACAQGEQRVNLDADMGVANPAFAANSGPSVVIDGAHHNFHTVDGRYAPFAQLLRNDGLRVAGSEAPFSEGSLRGVDILVVANALAPENVENSRLPNASAFTLGEIASIRRFVERGGALLLIADHMPFAGAAQDLGAAFGIQFDNGFAMDGDDEPDLFTRENGGLVDDPIAEGVTQVRTFTGSAFHGENGVRPLLRLGPRWVVRMPEEAGTFTDNTPQLSGEGKLQGALIEFGAGRVAVFSEAAMFTAQVTGTERMGLDAPGAEDNRRFLLNVVHWLALAPQARSPYCGVRC